ncbi:hypothetical protein [Mannheimia massilioguelmaensis]|uniref:hypothetical protein n=1 Tax=Mannheimia massilioguelmaensis TaxID=1604354 RepID=UPI0005C87595|nr:hypothetical protein [Mannheimia massilioguelmaensis]
MRVLCMIFSIAFLVSCSFGGFKPPKLYYIWYTGKSFYDPNTGAWIGKFDFFTQREVDMRACGMDPVLGESVELKVNLCMEKKGWYLEQGPVCEEKYVWNEPECIKWRAKHSKPDAKPWG